MPTAIAIPRRPVAAFASLLALLIAGCGGRHPATPSAMPAAVASVAATATVPATTVATTTPAGTPSIARTAYQVSGGPAQATPPPSTSTPTATPTATPAPRPPAPTNATDLLRREIVPTTAECLAVHLPACYTPAQIRTAYGLDALAATGLDGTGQTIVIIDSFGSPSLQADVAAFDKAMGLPDFDLQQLYPLGKDFKEISRSDTQGWAGETTLDVEWAHAMAPKARIIVLVSPVSETEGVDGMPEFLALEQYALDNKLGTVISQSWGTSENLLEDDAGAALRAQFDAFYQQATAAGITIVSSAGDHGPLADRLDESADTIRSADWPAGEPYLTIVGGTSLRLNPDNTYLSERVWSSGGDAGGSGVSRFYPQPAEQAVLPAAIQQQLQGMRGEADVSALAEGLLLYFAGSNGGPGHADVSGGTSASAPIWAGIVALANQAAGHGLGNINPTLYALGNAGQCFHDVTAGANKINADPGEPALPGWDFPTGWGSPIASCLVPALAKGVQP